MNLQYLDVDQYKPVIGIDNIFLTVEQHNQDNLGHKYHFKTEHQYKYIIYNKHKEYTLRSFVFNSFPSNNKSKQVKTKVNQSL